jgi:hypothetical protein
MNLSAYILLRNRVPIASNGKTIFAVFSVLQDASPSDEEEVPLKEVRERLRHDLPMPEWITKITVLLPKTSCKTALYNLGVLPTVVIIVLLYATLLSVVHPV